ncbi:MAG TPA: hypothetical protein VMT75_10425 [Candidatus Saccharimonadales bacterium]|nr:hypothetical protein [Candidatus Saccharimonadales bacterium]
MRANYGSSRAQLERDALRLLCSELIEPETRVRLAATLQADMFADELNRVVYEEITRAGAVPIRRLKEWLPGRVTLRGFPDFELSDALGKNGAAEDIDRLFESLLELAEQAPRIGKKALGQSA